MEGAVQNSPALMNGRILRSLPLGYAGPCLPSTIRRTRSSADQNAPRLLNKRRSKREVMELNRVAAFDLTRNAFALLDVTPRANRAQLEDAYQDALLESDDHKAEAALNRAQQSLISPRERLEGELGFFINTKPSTAKAILSALRNGADSVPIGEIAGLDLINLSAHLCGVGTPSVRFEHATQLIAAYEALDVAEISLCLNALRSISGFGLVEPAQVKSALNRLRLFHARAALEAILSNDDGMDYLGFVDKA